MSKRLSASDMLSSVNLAKLTVKSINQSTKMGFQVDSCCYIFAREQELLFLDQINMHRYDLFLELGTSLLQIDANNLRSRDSTGCIDNKYCWP